MKYLPKKIKLLFSITFISLLIAISTSSYGYFTALLAGNDSAGLNAITTGRMEVEYDEGEQIGTSEDMTPGHSIVKTFSVKNTGDVTARYNIYLTRVVNTFVDKNDLVYTLTSNDGGTNIGETVCPSQDVMIASDITIDVGDTHNYTFNVTFKDDGTNQNDNLGAYFDTVIYIEQNTDKFFDEALQPFYAENIVLTKKRGTLTVSYPYDVYDRLNEGGYYNSLVDCQIALNHDFGYQERWQEENANPTCTKAYSVGDIAPTDIYFTESDGAYGFWISDYECDWTTCTKEYSQGETITKDIYVLKYFDGRDYYTNLSDLQICESNNGVGNCGLKFRANQVYTKENVVLADNMTLYFDNNKKFVITADLLKNTVSETKQAVIQRLTNSGITNYEITEENENGYVDFYKDNFANDPRGYNNCRFDINNKELYCRANNYCSSCSMTPEVSFLKNGIIRLTSNNYMS